MTYHEQLVNGHIWRCVIASGQQPIQVIVTTSGASSVTIRNVPFAVKVVEKQKAAP